MNPEEIRTLIDGLKEQNNNDLRELDKLMQERKSFGSLKVEEREVKKEDISKLDNNIDNLIQAIENRNKEIERQDKLLSIQTNSSMQHRNVKDDLDNATQDEDKELRQKVDNWFKTGNDKEIREALQAGIASAGGNTIAPQYLVKDVIKGLDDQVHIRKHAKIIPPITGYQTIGIPTLTNDLNDHDWTAELGAVKDDPSIAFGKREMKSNQLTKLVKISKQLIRNSNIDIQGFVQERIAYSLARPLENAYLYGDGKDKPLGIFAQTSDNSSAIPSDRDISVGTATEAISYEGLVDAVSALKSGYHGRAVWMLNRKAIAYLRKLKDTIGRPLWQDGIQGTGPNRLLGIPVVQNDFITDELASGKYCGLLADFSNYWILDSLSMELQVLHELYANTNQIGFQTTYWGDGAPILAEAFVRIVAHNEAYAKKISGSAKPGTDK